MKTQYSVTKERDRQLMETYEKTYDAEFPVNFVEPQTNLLDDFIVDKIKAIYKTKMQDKDKGGLECDWWTAVIGSEGVGKSTFAVGYIYEYCKIAGLNFVELLKSNVAFDEFDMLKMISNIDINKFFQFILADEGANVWFNRESNSKLRKFSVKFMNSMRFLRYFSVICAVEIAQLDTIIRDHRLKTLIRIQEQGIYHYYNHEQLIRLLFMNRKTRDAHFNWKSVEPEHIGFFNWSPETKNLVDILKKNYLIRFQMEVSQEYQKELMKRMKSTI